MPHIPSILNEIQTLELAVDRARSRQQDIDDALAHDERVLACQTAADEADQALHQARASVNDLQLEISSLTQKIEDVDKLLYSGQITNPKELKDRQDELESLRRRLASLEEHLVEAKNILESRQTENEQAQQDLAAAIVTRDKEQVDLIAEHEQLTAEIKANLKQRKGKVTAVPDATLKHYRSLRKRKNGQAVAVLNIHSCTACGIEQPRSEVQRIMQDDELVYCIGCGRILAIR